MAMIDYGAVTKKNGVNIQTDFFTPMEKCVGFNVDKAINIDDKSNMRIIEGNYYSYAGTSEFFLCFYKCHVIAVSKVNDKYISEWIEYPYENTKEKKFKEEKIETFGHLITIKCLDGNGEKFICKYTDENGIKWETLFGFGIDYDINVIKRLRKNKDYGYKNTNVYNKVINFFANSEIKID